MAAILLYLIEVERPKLFKYLNLKKLERDLILPNMVLSTYITVKILLVFRSYQDSTVLIKHLTYSVQISNQNL